MEKVPQPGLTREKVRLVWWLSRALGALLVILGTLEGDKGALKPRSSQVLSEEDLRGSSEESRRQVV